MTDYRYVVTDYTPDASSGYLSFTPYKPLVLDGSK